MTEVIGVKFKEGGKVYFFNPMGITVKERQEVIVDTSRGIEFGICAEANKEVEDDSVVAPLRPLVRIATDEDKKRLADNKEKEKKAFDICLQKITEHSLDMKLIDVQYNFDGSKILFFFTSDGRVDFRELVKVWPQYSKPHRASSDRRTRRGKAAWRTGHLRKAFLLLILP
jgi:cell fate regulator YaaT (PSP1 superfamily)